MLLRLSNTIPRISFDNNKKIYQVVFTGDVIKVWVKSIFNNSNYETTLNTSQPYKKISDYEYEITARNEGFNTLSITILDKKTKDKITNSNNILLIIQ